MCKLDNTAAENDSYHIRQMHEICAGDHICCLFDNEKEKQQVLVDFYKGGIANNEKMIFLGDTDSINSIVSLLEEGGIEDIRKYVEKGQFVAIHYLDMYVENNVFEPSKIISRLKNETQNSIAEGYTSVRGTGDMGWATVHKDLTKKLMIYESMLNTFFNDCVLGMCLYDTRLFAPEGMLQVLSTHPDAIIKGKLYHNIYYMPPHDYLSKNVHKAMLSRWMNNIEERQNMEEQLIASKMEAEKAGQAKANFLATMSHEIRNPTNGLIGSADLLTQTRITKEQQEYISIIQSTAKHLYTVVNDVLDFSKIEDGKLELISAPVDLEGCVKESMGLCQYTTQKNLSVRVVQNVDPGCPKSIMGDATRLRQILVNLIGNACKFSEQGDIVVDVHPLTTPPVPLPEGKECFLEFSVTDQGKGISEEDQAKLFQKFSQVDNQSQKYVGTGLGLVICKQLVEAMQGHIAVKSKLGEGSTFYFWIPVATSAGNNNNGNNATSAASKTSSNVPVNKVLANGNSKQEISSQNNTGNNDGNTRKRATSNAGCDKQEVVKTPAITEVKNLDSFSLEYVLVVEDNLANQKIMKRMLEKIGCIVDVADNGLEAIEAAKNKNYSVIFMDMYMPKCDGFTAAQRIREIFSGLGRVCPKIVAFTGTYETRLDGVMDDVLVKPVLLNSLALVVDKYCHKVNPLVNIAPHSNIPTLNRTASGSPMA